MAYSKQIANLIISYLEKEDFHYDYDKDTGVIRTNVSISGKLQKLRYVFTVYESDFDTYAIINLNADEEQRPAVAEFLTRANYGLKLGNFEMDYRDGEVRYKCAVDCDECMPSEKVVQNTIYIPYNMFKRYGDGLLAVMFGLKSAADSIKEIEG
ncbi:MAG: YbjN domain-containing protein [Lachnospiraceae bacterium]|jgi:hypothetical protein